MSYIIIYSWIVSPILIFSLLPSYTLSQDGSTVKPNIVKVYADADYKGSNATLNANKCISPLPEGLDNAISSVDSQGNCVHLYEAKGCEGDYIIVKPRTPSHGAIHDYIGYHDATSSIGPCQDECHPSNIQISREGPTRISLYDHSDFKGNQVKLDVKDCVTVPKRMKKKASSIQIHDSGVCIELYEFWNCTGPSAQFRKGTPSHHNLWSWGFNDQAASASLCGYNCYRKDNHSAELGMGDTVRLKESKIVTIYSEVDFKGDSFRLSLKEGCVNIADEWEGEAESIQTYGLCVHIYAQPNCSRKNKNLELSNAESNLKSKDFDRMLRSIESCDNFRKLRSETDDSNGGTLLIIIWIILGVFVLAVVIAAVVIVRLRRNHKRVVDILTEKEIEEFIRGIESHDAIMGEILNPHNQPYNQNYEIPKDYVRIDMQSPLGSGEYAIVYPGRLKRPNSATERLVAVKTVKPYAGAEYVKAMLKEIKTMIYVGPQPRIVELVGCYTQNLRNAELFVLTELCSNGSLEKFLQNHRDAFVNFVDKGQIQLESLELGFTGNYTNVETPTRTNFNTFHLLQWSLEIAEGMDYLANKKVIHGDLATRNILLDANFNTKISDFGLSKQLYEYTQYVKKQQAPLPWRWLALESLKTLQFSTESDVWAFGVTIWEIFTLGDVPYPGMVWGDTFMLALTDGLRLSKPKYATSDCYNLMLSCWRERPQDRISFTDLRLKFEEFLAEIINSTPSRSNSVHNQEYSYLPF